jgi:hypothetical protein
MRLATCARRLKFEEQAVLAINLLRALMNKLYSQGLVPGRSDTKKKKGIPAPGGECGFTSVSNKILRRFILFVPGLIFDCFEG